MEDSLKLPPGQERQLWRTSEEDIECVEELAGWLLQPLRRSFSLRRRLAVAVRSPSRVRVRQERKVARFRFEAVPLKTR